MPGERTSSGSVACDFCEAPAIAVSTEGRAETRRARCADHRVLGGELGDVYGRGRKENDWVRDSARHLDNDVIPELRRRNNR